MLSENKLQLAGVELERVERFFVLVRPMFEVRVALDLSILGRVNRDRPSLSRKFARASARGRELGKRSHSCLPVQTGPATCAASPLSLARRDVVVAYSAPQGPCWWSSGRVLDPRAC